MIKRRFPDKRSFSDKKTLDEKQQLAIKKHIDKIQEAQKELQQTLTELGLQPVGGWKEITDYQIVSGLELVKSDCDHCVECSIVCFDGSCDCVECPGMPDATDHKKLQFNLSYPVDRVLLETPREGGIRVHLIPKKF